MQTEQNAKDFEWQIYRLLLEMLLDKRKISKTTYFKVLKRYNEEKEVA